MIRRIASSPFRRHLRLPGALTLLLILAACAQPGADAHAGASGTTNRSATVPSTQEARKPSLASTKAASATPVKRGTDAVTGSEVAIFAGGCFWCMEPPYDELPGVISTESGYIGGHVAKPSYEQVSAGGTGHTEAIRVTYDPGKVDYPELLEVFWRNIDPVAVDRQFCDAGSQYRSAIFPVNNQQRLQAEASKKAVQADPRFQRPIATQVEPTATFYPAENYHQDYYRKNPVRYKYYRYSCGRDRRLQEIWGDAK